jgi:tRNA-Thr(GGU) m(6)t(6)A37 methyltransferase TsaA
VFQSAELINLPWILRDEMITKPVGIIKTPFKTKEDIPIQSVGVKDIEGSVEIYDEFRDGIKDLEGFSHIYLLFEFHKSEGYQLIVKSFLDDELKGVFATRAPRRPNAIGMSVVRLISVEGNTLKIRGVDMLDGTPLLDIKPYVSKFDAIEGTANGWLEDKMHKAEKHRSDERFS